MSPSRRTLLTGAAALTLPMSGCLNQVLGRGPAVDLILRNYTSEAQPLQVELLREDRSEISEAQVLRREFEVPPPSGEDPAGVVRRPELVPRTRYLVRVRLKFGRGEWDHTHFVPGRSGAAEIDIRVYRDDETGALYTRFF